MNYRHNESISWNLIDTAATSSFDVVEPCPGWYPSPPAEETMALFDHPCPRFEEDLDLSGFTGNAASGAYLTPPTTSRGSPVHIQEEQSTMVSFSTTFYPGNPEILIGPDMVLSSDDGTLFYLNSHLLASAGFTVFSFPALETFNPPSSGSLPGSALLHGGVTKLPDDSVTLSLIFHILYGLSCAVQEPSLDDLSKALSCMSKYNLSPSTLIQPGTPLYVYLMASYAPYQPLKLYILAAHHTIEPLAVAASSHLLGYDLSQITDEEATSMRSIYLKRLFFMHKGRTERLKSVLVKPPSLHDLDQEGCDAAARTGVLRKWALLVTSLAWDAKPDISPHSIQEHLRPMGDMLPCRQCQDSWKHRSVSAATEWATVKFTI